MEFEIKRVYDPVSKDDGFRVLADRLWPRGVKKESLQHDLWPKELAPSTEARRDFNHEPGRFAEFRRRYLAELDGSAEAAQAASNLVEEADQEGKQKVTLLYAAKDPECNHALILRDWLAENYG